jgi:O-antigen/teichoic acid export membrane protein
MRVSDTIIARNTALNLVGQVLPIIGAVLATPVLVHRLGASAYGILSLALVVLNYFGLFDLGFGRATTKFAAECIALDTPERLSSVVKTSLTALFLLGVIAALILEIASSFLTGSAFKVPQNLVGEGTAALRILAMSLPFLLAGTAARGTLEAAQRFDLINLVQVPFNTATFLAPAVCVFFGAGLTGAVLAIAITRVGAALLFYSLHFAVYSRGAGAWFDTAILRQLIGYGGWLTIGNSTGPFVTNLSRIAIGILMPVAAVTQFSVPYQVVTAFWILPVALVTPLFPAFSALGAKSDWPRISSLYGRAFKFVLITVGPAAIGTAALSDKLLGSWIGPDFAIQATTTLRVLAIGALFNAVARVPESLIQGLGRPDLPAKLLLIELPAFLLLTWALVARFGVVGAAAGWACRAAADAVLLATAAFLLMPRGARRTSDVTPVLSALLALGGGFFALGLVGASIGLRLLFTCLVLPTFAVWSWSRLLDKAERGVLLHALVVRFRRGEGPVS